MPFRRAPATPDLERVAQVLSGGRAGGWIPSRPGGDALPGLYDGEEVAGVRALGAEEGAEGGGHTTRPGAATEAHEPADLAAELERLDIDLRRARRPGLLTAPEPIRLGRWSVSSPAVLSVLALVVALGCAFAIRILWAERAADAASPARGASALAAGAPAVRTTDGGAPGSGATAAGSVVLAGPSGAASAPSGAPGPAAQIVVHVVGQVARPGLVRLRSGARVADAIAAAGGARSGADLSALNLARLVVDGEQVRVPKPGEAVPAPGGGGSGPVGAVGGGSGSGGAALVNLNTADLTSLDSLPGVGPVLAQRILDWRTEHGRFTSVDELGEVSGIGDKLMAQLRPKVTV
ncbi:hypothetical protein N865_01680 [Intrasporangium oryzae NRRL B-24470]|uniref:Helix-hairpin-helix DNA-binding motif class 1 domain-containing protein n=1 Tax=Intrasporangium oryzae NRRL B-24470 TaxID=1386089 RepID=W9GD56_9MICO|nr:helix-hairpin-helix domain-containing protein [Intrasporangium oryzae]EWT03152.1 hypothetical protein N865_01680 [Intrasporangium oryzae NRRL B-24470]